MSREAESLVFLGVSNYRSIMSMYGKGSWFRGRRITPSWRACDGQVLYLAGRVEGGVLEAVKNGLVLFSSPRDKILEQRIRQKYQSPKNSPGAKVRNYEKALERAEGGWKEKAASPRSCWPGLFLRSCSRRRTRTTGSGGP